jgi:hypothetical protein
MHGTVQWVYQDCAKLQEKYASQKKNEKKGKIKKIKVVEKLEISCGEGGILHFFFENPAVYKVTWKNILERGRTQMTVIWRMCIACCIPMATNTHTGCVILIAFPL